MEEFDVICNIIIVDQIFLMVIPISHWRIMITLMGRIVGCVDALKSSKVNDCIEVEPQQRLTSNYAIEWFCFVLL